jgi:hypothetical protein
MLCCLLVCGRRETSFVTSQLEDIAVLCVVSITQLHPASSVSVWGQMWFGRVMFSSCALPGLDNVDQFSRLVAKGNSQLPALVPTNRINFTFRTHRAHLSPVPHNFVSTFTEFGVIQCLENRNVFVFISWTVTSIGIMLPLHHQSVSTPKHYYTQVMLQTVRGIRCSGIWRQTDGYQCFGTSRF